MDLPFLTRKNTSTIRQFDENEKLVLEEIIDKIKTRYEGLIGKQLYKMKLI